MGFVIALILLLVVLFFKEIFPLALTALVGAAALMATGILTPEEGFSGFSSPATVAILAMFVLSAGVEKTGIVNALTKRLMKWAKGGPRRQIIALGFAAGPISGFVNNTPVVAVLIPSAVQMAKEAGRAASRLLMPLSMMAMLGGLLTIVGTSTNLLGNAVLVQQGIEPFGFFEFVGIGAIALGIGLIYFLTLGYILLPDRTESDLIQRFDLEGFMAEYIVEVDSPLEGVSLADAGLSLSSDVQVIRLRRATGTLRNPRGNTKIRIGDHLLVEAGRERLDELAHTKGLVADSEARYDLGDDGDRVTAEAVVTVGSRYVGRTIAQIRFRERYDAVVIAVRHEGKSLIGPLSHRRLRPGDVLLVQATASAVERMRERPDLYVTREREQGRYRTGRLPHALLIMLGVVVTAAFGILPIAVAALAGATLMVITGCLDMQEFMDSIHWDIILLLAGIIPLGIAFTKVGLAEVVAGWLGHASAYLPGLGFLILLFVVTSMITEILSNSASVVLLVPVVLPSAVAAGMDPRQAALVVMMAASTSMLTPIGYQTNTMIYAPGNYRFSDFARVGGPLNLLLAFFIPAAVYWLL